MFQVKDFRSIVASMINYFRGVQDQVTDFNVGSVARTLLEAPAIEIDELYQQMFNGLYESIPAAVYSAFGFERIPAMPASGVLIFTLDAAQATSIVVPAGFVVANSDAVQYQTTADLVIPAGQTSGSVGASAKTSGTTTNTGIATITVLVDTVDHVVSANNIAAFTGGTDDETDAARQDRFRAYIQTLPRGTINSLKYGASLSSLAGADGVVTEAVKYATVIEPFLSDTAQPIGLVNVHIHNGVGGTSAPLVAKTLEVLTGYYLADGTPVPGWKAAGIKLQIFAATDIAATVAATLTMAPGHTVSGISTLATAEISDYITSLPIGSGALRAELIAILMSYDGVANVVLSSPVSDVSVTSTQKVIPGTITLS